MPARASSPRSVVRGRETGSRVGAHGSAVGARAEARVSASEHTEDHRWTSDRARVAWRSRHERRPGARLGTETCLHETSKRCRLYRGPSRPGSEFGALSKAFRRLERVTAPPATRRAVAPTRR